MDEFRHEHAERIGENRKEIPASGDPVAVCESQTEQHQISRYGIGKDIAAAEISVDVEKTADYAQHAGGGKPFGIGSGVDPCHARSSACYRFLSSFTPSRKRISVGE